MCLCGKGIFQIFSPQKIQAQLNLVCLCKAITMKTIIKRSLVVLGVVTLGLFLTAFIYANWEAPTPGRKAPVVDFLQYDAAAIGDSAQVKRVQATLSDMDGVRGSTYNGISNLLVVSYGVADIDRSVIESTIKYSHDIVLQEKTFEQSGPKCPIDMAMISRVKRILCVRD